MHGQRMGFIGPKEVHQISLHVFCRIHRLLLSDKDMVTNTLRGEPLRHLLRDTLPIYAYYTA